MSERGRAQVGKGPASSRLLAIYIRRIVVNQFSH